MSRTYKDSPQYKRNHRPGGRTRPHNISVRAVRRDPPDLRRLARAVIELALAQAEADAANDERPGKDEDGTSPEAVDE